VLRRAREQAGTTARHTRLRDGGVDREIVPDLCAAPDAAQGTGSGSGARSRDLTIMSRAL
jgi:hypothetical protein